MNAAKPVLNTSAPGGYSAWDQDKLRKGLLKAARADGQRKKLPATLDRTHADVRARRDEVWRVIRDGANTRRLIAEASGHSDSIIGSDMHALQACGRVRGAGKRSVNGRVVMTYEAVEAE